MKSKFQKIKGTYDILPPEIEKWSQATSILQSISKQFGYEEIKTPIIENIDLFKQNIGYDTDVSKEMFTWKDSSKNQLVLKPEMTAPVVRAFIESGFFRSKPLCKLFYIDALFRREKPQKGRQRQFHQFGIEALGSSEIEQDVEVNFQEILSAIVERDHQDKTRSIAPLRAATDAIIIDTGNMNIDKVMQNLLGNVDRSKKYS